jgi:hypothetical protein
MPRATHTCPHASTQHPHSPQQESEKRDCPQSKISWRRGTHEQARASAVDWPRQTRGCASLRARANWARAGRAAGDGRQRALGVLVRALSHSTTSYFLPFCTKERTAHNTHPRVRSDSRYSWIDPTTSVKRQQQEAAAGRYARFLHAHGLTQKDRPPPALWTVSVRTEPEFTKNMFWNQSTLRKKKLQLLLLSAGHPQTPQGAGWVAARAACSGCRCCHRCGAMSNAVHAVPELDDAIKE